MKLIIDVPGLDQEQYAELARSAQFQLAEIRWIIPAAGIEADIGARPIASAARAAEPKPRRRLPYSQTPELDAEVLRRVRAGEPVSRGALAAKFGVTQYTVQLRHERARVLAEAEAAGEKLAS